MIVPGYTEREAASLLAILQMPRPSGKLYTMTGEGWETDAYGNCRRTVLACPPRGKPTLPPTTLFTAHFDTVDHRLRDEQKQLSITAQGVIHLESQHSCLGADDGAGIWLLLEMIRAGVPGVYMLFQDEEAGQRGSEHAASKPEDFAGIERCISFDRRGVADVITHQRFGRCCSDDFANALADSLNQSERCLYFCPSDDGIVTDSANFIGVIPECTNISIGYKLEHSANESLDTDHLLRLRNACLRVKWDELPTVRDPKAKDYDYSMFGFMPDFTRMDYAKVVEWVKQAHVNDVADALTELAWELELCRETDAYSSVSPPPDEAGWRALFNHEEEDDDNTFN